MAWMARRRCAGCEKTARSSSTSGRRIRSALELAGISGADKRSHSPGRRTRPPGPSSHMTPTTVSTPPPSKGRQRARTARARGIRPTTVSSAPVRIHLRIRLPRVNGGAPYLPAEPADWLHTTRFRRCDRRLITAPCHPRLRSGCPQWYAPGLFSSVPRRAVAASAPRSSSLTPASYALRGCHDVLLAGSNPALASRSRVDAGGDRWLLVAVRGHLGGHAPVARRPGSCWSTAAVQARRLA